MRKASLFLLLCYLCFTACSNKYASICQIDTEQDDIRNIYDVEVVDIGCLTDNVHIGKKLENPYSIKNMKAACDDLYPATKGEGSLSDSLIVPNSLYVRFLPKDSTEVNILLNSNLELFNYPLDYEILGDISDYYDSSFLQGKVAWQYTTVPINTTIPDIEHEVLDICYIPQDDSNSPFQQIIGSIEDHAFGCTGNGGSSSSGTGSSNMLKGRIRVYDESATDYVGVKGIKVRARTFMKIMTAYTNENGEFSIQNVFSANPRYELRFENVYGFLEGYGLDCLVLPSTYDMQGNRYINLNKETSQKWWALSFASHFQSLGNDDYNRSQWWSMVFDYELSCLSSSSYGDPGQIGSGPCGVTEMWAYTTGYYMSRETTPSMTFPRASSRYWFKPDALWDLLVSGTITLKDAADCLNPSVCSVVDFIEQLVSNNPSKESAIRTAYERY